ncbi:hypothetical protein TNCT_283131 [Trichonephila clavata]|uniref:Uncharacterized protein n=1 Tax=Trichonephila clavata TaxID=2740835 RepID=A0A8X6KNJ8_TRICU|nr:hypothetical protein TNCT_283131 [Trichonephila clavata]
MSPAKGLGAHRTHQLIGDILADTCRSKTNGHLDRPKIYDARQTYVSKMLRIEKDSNGENTETFKKLEKQATDIAEKITSEGKMLGFCPAPQL